MHVPVSFPCLYHCCMDLLAAYPPTLSRANFALYTYSAPSVFGLTCTPAGQQTDSHVGTTEHSRELGFDGTEISL